MDVRFILFDRWDNQITTLDPYECKWTEEINGEDTLDMIVDYPVTKGNRIVWHDGQGLWHEHIVAGVEQTHSDGAVLYELHCENSISELYGDYIDDKRPSDATASSALSVVLAPTRWTVGSVTVTGTNSTTFYRINCREALHDLIEVWGGELSTTITVGDLKVTSRKVNLTRRGSDNGRRFEYGHDMTDIRRVFDADDVISALRGFGKGEEVGDGYGRGIDFASINGGRNYVYDNTVRDQWGRPNASGTKVHVYGQVEFSDCDDPAELLRLTKAEFEKRKVPKVSYTASVDTFSRHGYDYEDVGLGDDVALIDREFEPEVRVKGRVTKLVRDLLDVKNTEITLGNIIENAADLFAQQYAELKSLSNRATSWDVAAYTPGAYIEQVMKGLNRQFDEGASYIYQSPEQGIIVASVPLNQSNGRPMRTPASAIQLKGGGFRIANTLLSNGEWNWRTFGTGSGFTADEINAGQIKGGSSYWNLGTGDLLFKQGTIADTRGRSTWNLSTGELTTSYMKATNIDASGKFQCGNTSELLIVQNGKITGSESGTVFGYIDFSAHSYNIQNTSEKYKGIQMQADGIIRISSPRISVAATPNVSTTTNTCYTGTIKQPLVSEIHNAGNGSVGWHYGTLKLTFCNGLLVGLTTVGT